VNPLLAGLEAGVLARRAQRDDEVADVCALLLEHADPAAGPPDAAAATAEWLAVACLGDNHLWQDLQLPSRAELTALMNHWFPALAARNDRDMKWKKFFYKQLCDRAEISVCRAPSCAVCSDYALCFEADARPAA
jgi:nitrogen fixation protein NifQ